jgi:hypothetical protein
MRILGIILMMAVLAGCAGNQDQEARSLFDRIEFGPDEVGCARITGQIDVGGNPFASSNVSVSIVKRKGSPEDDIPDC